MDNEARKAEIRRRVTLMRYPSRSKAPFIVCMRILVVFVGRAIVAVATMTPLIGCCHSLSPSPKEVQTWVDRELPVGSSEADVQRFSESHHFRYERDSASYGQAYRPMDGCDWKKPTVQVEVTYDETGRVRSAVTRSFSAGLP
jgi:hypothetical protein